MTLSFSLIVPSFLLALSGRAIAVAIRPDYVLHFQNVTSNVATANHGSSFIEAANTNVAPIEPPKDTTPVQDNYSGTFVPISVPSRPSAPLDTSILASSGTWLKIEIYNGKDEQIPLVMQKDPGSPQIFREGSDRTVLEPYENATFWATQGYEGMIALGHGEGSKIESSFSSPSNFVPHVDVSYVDGFTHEIVCSCAGVPYTGCNVDLFSQPYVSCPRYGRSTGVCYNPARAYKYGPAHPFFKACEGSAYTFPTDDRADHGCPSNDIQCCVGPTCEPSIYQPGYRATN